MYTTLHTGEIIFYYAQPDIFDDVKHQSAFMCKNILSKEGEDLSERFLITDDEEPMIGICIRESLPNIFEAVRPLTHGISDAFKPDMTGAQIKAISGLENLDVDTTTKYVVIRTQDNGAYNPNEPGLADSAILSAVESGALSEYYSRVVNRDLTELSAGRFGNDLNGVMRRIIPLRKKSQL